MGGGQNILSPPIFLNGGSDTPRPPSDAPIYSPIRNLARGLASNTVP